MQKFLYTGPSSGVTLRHGPGTLEVLLWHNRHVMLPAEHPYTERLQKLGYLHPLEQPLAELLNGTVADVVARLEGLGADALARLGELEANGKHRSTILQAIEKQLNSGGSE